MTVRPHPLRPGALLVLLLLAVLVHNALQAILACQLGVEERPVALVSAVSDPSPAGACPGCLLEQPLVIANTAPPAASPAQPALVQDPCTPTGPCQHGPTGEHGTGDLGTRLVGAQRDTGPALVCSGQNGPPPGHPVVVPDPALIAAGLTPVAVLCVDRN